MVTSDHGVNHVLLVSAAALFDGAGRVLIQRRPLDRALPGLWEFPGGKVEANEAPIDALIRELDEELGIQVGRDAVIPLSFATEPLANRHLILLLFGVRHWQGTPVAHHASALKWIAPADMNLAVMPPADGPLVMALRRLVRLP